MQWCMPIIAGAQKAKAGESQVQDQPGQFSETLCENNKTGHVA